jgi:hypothetical protein
MAWPSEEHRGAAARRVRGRALEMERHTEFGEGVEARAVRPNVDIERDNAGRLAGKDDRYRIWPAPPPIADRRRIERGIMLPVWRKGHLFSRTGNTGQPRRA